MQLHKYSKNSVITIDTAVVRIAGRLWCMVTVGKVGKVAVSWLKILAANPNPNPTILSHEITTLPQRVQ